MPSSEQICALIFLWAAWCGLHSLLLMTSLRARLQKTLGMSQGRYRLAYSLFSLLSIYPVYKYTVYLGGIYPYFWPRPWLWPQLALLACGAWLLAWSSLDFIRGGFDFLGVSHALHGQDNGHHLVTGGAYGHVRHPMHLASLVLVWARSLGPADLAVSLVLTAYILLGTWHEESRLRRQFGEEYREYAGKVPLMPFLK